MPNSIDSRDSVTKCQSRIRLFIRVIITLIALAACSYQVYLVAILYFKYPTTVDIRMDPSPNVQLPGITICSELSSTILVEELVKIQPALYNTFAGKTRTEISLMLKKHALRELLVQSLHTLPIDHQHKLTVTSKMFFKQCQVPTPLTNSALVNQKDRKSPHLINIDFYNSWTLKSYEMINCTQIAPIVETISFDFKCFTLFHNETFNVGDNNNEIPKDVVGNLKYLAWIQLNRDFIFNGLIYIHQPELSHQFASTSNIQQIDPDTHEFVSIAFEREILKLLPPPYETNCHDYRKEGYSCREDCITDCKTKRYLEKDNGWPGDVYADKNVTQRISVLWTNFWSNVGHLQEGLDVTSLADCSNKCGHRDDCESVKYDVRTVRVKERDEDDAKKSHTFTVGVMPPKNVQLVSKHVPKFETIEFLIYLGGLISLYTGITAISLGVNILSFLTCSNKCQRYLCNCGEKETSAKMAPSSMEKGEKSESQSFMGSQSKL